MNECAICQHKQDPTGTGHCYMFKTDPHNQVVFCGQFKAPANAGPLLQTLSLLKTL